MTRLLPKGGFPTVPKLDLKFSLKTPTGVSSDGKKKKKKSLFAQQFGAKDLSFFGIDCETSVERSSPQRDKVQPILIGGEEIRCGSHDVECQLAQESGSDQTMEFSDTQLLKDDYGSTAARTWDR